MLSGVRGYVYPKILKITKKGNLQNSEYPIVSILPITHSRVYRVLNSWIPMETRERMLFRENDARDVLKARSDNSQMLEIFNLILDIKSKEKLAHRFDYHEDILLPEVPVTQAYTFCLDEKKRFCIVRDSGENHFSLPGGGVELGEAPENAARRELMEETQISCGQMTLLGSSDVSYLENGRVVERVQQARYLCSAINIPRFKKNYKGFETEERLFVTFDALPKYVTWLKDPVPQQMLRQIFKII